MEKVNIIIPVHNRGYHTRQTLESLFRNTNPDLYKLYVIDDVSDEATRNMLTDFAMANGNMILIRNDENLGPAWSRNMMCDYITKKNERYEYLYHSDNDVFFTEGWLDTLLWAFPQIENAGIKLLGGGCHPYLQNNGSCALNDFKTRVGMKDAVSGYSQLMTWGTWDTYGPFSDSNKNQGVKIMGSEDWAFCQEIIKAGFMVGSIEPEVVIATGKTNTYGLPATGSETFKEVEGVQIR